MRKPGQQERQELRNGGLGSVVPDGSLSFEHSSVGFPARGAPRVSELGAACCVLPDVQGLRPESQAAAGDGCPGGRGPGSQETQVQLQPEGLGGGGPWVLGKLTK